VNTLGAVSEQQVLIENRGRMMRYYFNQSVAKAVAILRCLSECGGRLSVTEISRRLGMTRSVAQKIVLTLADLEMVDQDAVSKKYGLSRRLLEMAASALNGDPLAREGLRYVRKLVELTDMTCALGVLDGPEVLYLVSLEADAPVKATSRAGDRSSVYCTATGKCLLAFSPKHVVDGILKDLRLAGYTKNTITDKRQLKQELEITKERGYALNREERVVGLCGIAAPILAADGEAAAAISVACPKGIVGRSTFAKLAEQAVAIAHEFSRVVQQQPVYPDARTEGGDA